MGNLRESSLADPLTVPGHREGLVCVEAKSWSLALGRNRGKEVLSRRTVGAQQPLER